MPNQRYNIRNRNMEHLLFTLFNFQEDDDDDDDDFMAKDGVT